MEQYLQHAFVATKLLLLTELNNQLVLVTKLPEKLLSRCLFTRLAFNSGVNWRHYGYQDDGHYHQRKVFLDNRDVAEKETDKQKAEHPQRTAYNIV